MDKSLPQWNKNRNFDMHYDCREQLYCSKLISETDVIKLKQKEKRQKRKKAKNGIVALVLRRWIDHRVEISYSIKN